MGKSLIITEKPSVAQEFAKVLQVSGRRDGYIENFIFENDQPYKIIKVKKL